MQVGVWSNHNNIPRSRVGSLGRGNIMCTYTVLSMGGRLLAPGTDYPTMRRRARELAECRGLYVEFHGPHMPVLYVYPGESS